MILPERVFGMSGHDVNALRAGDFADHRLDGGGQLLDDELLWKHARFQRNVNFGNAALDVVHHRDHRGLGNFVDGQASGFEFLGAEPMSRNVNDIIYAAEDAVNNYRGGSTAPSAA